jgi:hypothetical protein
VFHVPREEHAALFGRLRAWLLPGGPRAARLRGASLTERRPFSQGQSRAWETIFKRGLVTSSNILKPGLYHASLGAALLACKKEGRRMPSHMAFIERSNRKDLDHVEVHVTIRELSAGRQSWSGEFLSRSSDGILPNERLSLTLDTGQKGTARVSETRFDSRTPEATMVHVTGTGPLV